MSNLDEKAAFIIASLYRLKLNREASSLGESLGAWRRGRIGDCFLRSCIASSIGAIKRMVKGESK